MKLRLRKKKVATLPLVPGWYLDGTDKLRYYSADGWTERTREIPSFATPSEFESLPPYQKPVLVPKRRSIVRSLIALTVVISVVGAALLQYISGRTPIKSPPTVNLQSISLIREPGYATSADAVCTSEMHSWVLMGNVHNGISAAVANNERLIRDMEGAEVRLSQLVHVPAIAQEASLFYTHWSLATQSIVDLDQAMTVQGGSAQNAFAHAEKSLAWIDGFSGANQVPGCGLFTVTT